MSIIILNNLNGLRTSMRIIIKKFDQKDEILGSCNGPFINLEDCPGTANHQDFFCCEYFQDVILAIE